MQATQATLNDVCRLLDVAVKAIQEQNEILRNLSFRSGSSRPPSPDVALTFVEAFTNGKGEIFPAARVTFHPPRKFVDGKTKFDYDTKKAWVKAFTSGLHENRHYWIEKILVLDKDNKPRLNDRGEQIYEWHYVFPLSAWGGVNERLQALGELKIDGMDKIEAAITASGIQPDAPLPDTKTPEQQARARLFAVGNNWAKEVNPTAGTFEERRHALANAVLGREIASFTQLTPADEVEIITAMENEMQAAREQNRRLANDPPFTAKDKPALYNVASTSLFLLPSEVDKAIEGMTTKKAAWFKCEAFANEKEELRGLIVWAGVVFEHTYTLGVSLPTFIDGHAEQIDHTSRLTARRDVTRLVNDLAERA